MESRENILQYRRRLDKTLASHDLANEETLKTLVKNQMLCSSQCEVEECTDTVIEKRKNEVSNFLQMLRSASVDDYDGSKMKETSHRGWKVKQDAEEYRVMYREGPQGTPFHTLLVEGYVDGPLDVCLCLSWESTLYKKWWPQTIVPTFKIVASDCLQRVRIGEQISLVRMKVSWPLSTREAVVHFFVFEYFQEDLVVVLLNTISDSESIDSSTHGFTKDGIPDIQDVVRIDVVGGFAIQKVNAGRSYFRTIANMDIKLDFVPPSFINFISRQLIGSGFRLYQKEVASISNGHEDFDKVLGGPLYTRIRKALYPDKNQNISVNPENCDKEPCVLPPEDADKESCVLPPEDAIKPLLVAGGNSDTKAFTGDYAPESFPEGNEVTDNKACCEIEEIEEEEIENNERLEQDHKEISAPTTSEISESSVKYTEKCNISIEVKHALETLEKAIFLIREYGVAPHTRSLQGLGNGQLMDFEGSAAINTKSSENDQIFNISGVVSKVLENKTVSGNHNEPRNSSVSISSRNLRDTDFDLSERNALRVRNRLGCNVSVVFCEQPLCAFIAKGSNSFSREANHNKIVPASPEEDFPRVSKAQQTALPSSNNEPSNEPISDGGTNGNELVNADHSGNHKSRTNEGKNKKLWLCCLHFTSGQLMS